MELWRASCV
uniref:Uncharacterized protein n=1 Tax=Anguilla anguilla TaxID=7936 RepID=A0A0E9SD77_ANGAN